jgi:hemerythrin-like domain-containing protein
MTDATMTHALPDIHHATAMHIVAIHRQMRIDTRRLVAAVETSTDLDRLGRLRPLARYALGFARELHLHHSIEDTHFFPAMTAAVPELTQVFDSLEDDHDIVAHVLDRWTPAVRRIVDTTAPFAPARAELLDLATTLRDLLATHLDIEDRLVVPRLLDTFTAAELEEVDARIKSSLPLRGLGFAIPWNVEAMPAEERLTMIRDAPMVLRVLYRANVGRFRRLADAAFGSVQVDAA